MIIRQALSQDAAELTEFNINMARETEGVELLPEVIGAGVRGEACVIHGRPAAKIVEFATHEGCDLIVMATSASRGLQHALLGSVTDKVIRLAHCPVLVVRLEA